ncbi:KDO2-lipid IV(A) lauroyltransferase [Sporomusaceae bacterium BoRhaA]|uniref:lysophospholipid acyltransferase family protein n=1 Tax=Pelorhabdus rhamnosifermentans TaxID=2772457 RepID=UPI001C060AF8|nr:lysophospholipid acyltransferase family protein [Pelorhabdus rhamnosifermentans]MBU2698976.1 KDO2-lipid IV(A) lauroyltransferase [Pelorhabdus rhamnosifermentans]
MYTFVIIFSRVICLLPHRLRRWIGNLLGQFCWLIVPTKRKNMAVKNAELSLNITKAEATGIVKQSVTRFGRMFMEVLYLPKITPEKMLTHVSMVGVEHLKAALAADKGVVLATAHSGNWEIMGAALAMLGFPLVAVVQKQTSAAMDRFINDYRTLAGMHVTYKSGVREMVRLLGQGMIIGLLADQDAGQDGVFVNFFGREASTPQGPAALARLKDAPIIPAFITQEATGNHTIHIYPAVWVHKTADRDDDIAVATQIVTTTVEQHIRRYPGEWFWLHNRWKTKRPY